MRMCYLLGYPLEHSLSPLMHNTAFRTLGLEYRYEAKPLKPHELEPFVQRVLRSPDTAGGNVTMPYKEKIIRLLDELDEETSEIGAVNTVVNVDGRLRGYNTDGPAALRALKEAYGPLSGVRAVVLGAGGAARAVVYHLCREASSITVLNRTPGRALRIVEDASRWGGCPVSWAPLTPESLSRYLSEADVLVNATPVGMYPNVSETPVPKRFLKSDMLVFDVVYNPPKTRLLREAEEVGAKTVSGVLMFVYQGAEAFRLWTGVPAPTEVMMRTVMEALGCVGT